MRHLNLNLNFLTVSRVQYCGKDTRDDFQTNQVHIFLFPFNDSHGGLVVRTSTSCMGSHAMGSIPVCNRPKFLKLVVVAFTRGAQDYGNGTMTGHQCQAN